MNVTQGLSAGVSGVYRRKRGKTKGKLRVFKEVTGVNEELSDDPD